MIYAHRTPPAMTLGVRETAEDAVRSGLRNILFAHRPETEALAMDVYLNSLKPVPSPYLMKVQHSPIARRGKNLFASQEIGCGQCHRGPFLTDQKPHAVGTQNRQDGKSTQFDTPSLCECWRHSPYLHDGSAVTIKEVLTTQNPADRHGRTSHLSPRQMEELTAFLLSL
jgi:cytochrome c peroxidase